MWSVNVHSKVYLDKPVFVEGLPGIGNVGKIAVDYIIENFKATLLRTYTSSSLPATAFVNSKNRVEVPKIFLFHSRVDGVDFLFLAGDVQPSTTESVYDFCNLLLADLKRINCKEVVTLGGIGYSSIPDNPKVLCASADSSIANKFVDIGADANVFGIVGPILGITGLMVGLARNYDLKAVALLVETFNHPTHLGLNESKSLLSILDKAYNLGVSFDHINSQISKLSGSESLMGRKAPLSRFETSYIG